MLIRARAGLDRDMAKDDTWQDNEIALFTILNGPAEVQ
jgi:hypothetical protein